MQIAILAGNNFQVLGGEERFILDLATALRADIILPTYNPSVIKTYAPDTDIKIISLNSPLPPEPLKIISGILLFKRLKLCQAYDFLIALDDMSVHALNKDVQHLYYVITPRKAYYEMYYDTLAHLGPLNRPIYSVALRIFSMYDRYYVKNNIKAFASISNNVRTRVCKTYQRHAPVIYPPIHIEKYSCKPSKGYWLSVGRIDKWKRTKLQIEAFRKMPNKILVIAGKIFPQYLHLKQTAPPNIVFLNNISEERLLELYSECEGFITTSFDEDFGITPLEAMASGKPVVATKEGGHLETIIDNHTGILVQPDIKEIQEAVTKISLNPSYYKDACIKQAARFNYKIFVEKINKVLYTNK